MYRQRMASITRWKSEPNIADSFVQRMQRSKSLGDIQYSNALVDQMRDHLRSLKDDLNKERHHVTELKRENVSNLRAAKEQEICDSIATQSDLVFNLMVEKDREIERLKQYANEYTCKKIDELEKRKNEEMRQLRTEFEYEKEHLINTLADKFRDEARNEIGYEFDTGRRQMETDYFMMASENKKLREDLRIAKDSDANKAEEIRKLYREYNAALSKIKRDASQDSMRQMGEIRGMQKIITELEKKLGLEFGTCLKLQMEKESLDDAFLRLKLADSWDKRAGKSKIKGIGGIDIEATYATGFAPKISSKSHNAPERVLQRKVLEMTSLIRRLDESNQSFAAKNQELVNELENLKNEREPAKQKTKRLGEKNMELVQSNKRKDERIVDQQQEILSLKEKLKTYDEIISRKNKELSKLKSKVQVQNETEINREEIDHLQGAMQEQLQIIYELRQQAVDKDRRIDVLRERMLKLKLRRKRKENGRVSTSPDSLNGSAIDDDNLSTTSESLNDFTLKEFEVSFDESKQTSQHEDRYKQLLKEKLEIERAYTLLQSQVGGHIDPDRMQLQIDALQSDLLVSQAKIQDLENQLEETQNEQMENNNNIHETQHDQLAEEKIRLRSANKTLHEKLISIESEVLAKNIEIARVTQNLVDVEEQRDLLDFRVAELEEKFRAKSPELESWQLTDDDKLGLSQDVDDVDCDAVSVRIALKELQINRQNNLRKREKSAIEKALDLIELNEKDIRASESRERDMNRQIKEIDCKYNNIKNELLHKDQQIALLTEEKYKSEEKQLLSIEDIFKDDEKALEIDNANLKQLTKAQSERLIKTQQVVEEMESANNVLRQKLEKYENEKKGELSRNEKELLEEKVLELEEMKKRLVEVEKLNLELEYKLESVKIEKYARDLVGNVVYNLPNSIAEEITYLDEEKRSLQLELEALRNRSMEPVFTALQDNVVIHKEQHTQTDTDQDDIPWHKYMSPRLDRSLSQNDSGMTSRLQTDEGTQTPRIREYDDLLERLEYEDYVSSAYVPKEDLHMDELATTFNDTTMLPDNSLESEVNQPSVESLFRFADRIVQEATLEAKKSIKDELNATMSTTLCPSTNETMSPFEFDAFNGPGDLIDIFIKRFEKREDESRKPPNEFLLRICDVSNAPSSCECVAGKELFQDPLEFNHHQIETSSVDENSKQTPIEEVLAIPESVSRGVQCDGFLLPSSTDELDCSNTTIMDMKLPLEVGNNEIDGEDMKEAMKIESSQSVASEDVADLLAYGKMLQENECLSSNDVSQNEFAEVTFVPNEISAINYDESFAVDESENNISIGSQSEGDRFAMDEVNKMSDKLACQFEPNEPKQPKCKANIESSFQESVSPWQNEISFAESNLSFHMGFLNNSKDNEFCDPRLNQTDDGSFISYSAFEIEQTSQPENISSMQSKFSISEHFDHVLPARPRAQSRNLWRSRSLSPKRRRKDPSMFLRCYSDGKDLGKTKQNICRTVPLSTPELQSTDKDMSYVSLPRHDLYGNPPMAMSTRVPENNENTIRSQNKRRKVPPAVLPKPSLTYSFRKHDRENWTADRFLKPDYQWEDVNLKKEVNRLREECMSLERQIKNKDNIMRTMKAELKEEVENIALLEKKEKLIQEKAESNAQLTQELQRYQKELDAKNAEINRKDIEISQLKTEIKNLEISKKYAEQSYTEVQVQVNKLEVVEKKLAEVQQEYDTVLLKNRELIDRIKHLEVAERDFIELERNVIDLQEQLQDLENIEAHRDELLNKFQNLKRQRDEFLERGRMVEEERNDFLRTNQTMEQRFEEFKKKYNTLKKTCGDLNRNILILEREKKELESKISDVQNDRNIVQTALGKLEVERDNLIREVKEVTSEKYILEQKLTEMDEMLSDHDHLEEGFHSLRLKLGEITRQRDDAEMLIPSLKAKIGLLKKACREKDETTTRYIEELKHYRSVTNTGNTNTGPLHEPVQQQPSRKQTTSSYFTESKRDDAYTTKPKLIYDASDESVVISEDDPSVIDDGSIDYKNDRRLQEVNRAIRSYDWKSRPTKRRRIYRALYDYDPYKSSASHHPERELRLKEGDYVTVYGEMDIDGYLEAEIDGETGLVPSIYIEESNDEYSTDRKLEHVSRDITSRSRYGARRRKFVCLYDYDPGTIGRSGFTELKFRRGDVITVIGDVDNDGYYSAELYGRTGLVKSTFVRELGVSKTDELSSYGASNQRREQKSFEHHSEIGRTSTGRTGSVEILRDDVIGPPFPPTNFKVLRIVSNDSLILTWNMPPIDKSGRSNGALVAGYKIWVNGKPMQNVNKYLMTKALISGLNLRGHLEFDIQTVADNGFCSEKCHFDIAGADSLKNPVYEEFFIKAAGNYRTFISLFDYDPYKSSPNQNPSLELQFNEGDLLKVYDTSRSDGFYHAEVRGRKGLVPSNFIEEISMPESSFTRGSETYSMRNGNESYARSIQNSHSSYSQMTSQQQQRQQQQQQTSTTEYEKRSSLSSTNGGRRRKMVASYDYDPLKQSPSKDKSKELNLRKGQYVTVIGDMRPDGFYLGEIDGRQGFVPGDFLEPAKDDDMESRRVQFASANHAD